MLVSKMKNQNIAEVEKKIISIFDEKYKKEFEDYYSIIIQKYFVIQEIIKKAINIIVLLVLIIHQM